MDMTNPFHFQSELDALRAAGLYRSLRTVDPDQPGRVRINGRSVILLASNNYLGLAEHPKVRAAAIEAIRRYGFGSGAARLISGHTTAHRELEDRLARFKNTEAALVFSTGYMANLGALSCLLPSKGLVLADRLCHASLIEGCRMSGSRFRVYNHGGLEQLERLLKKRPKNLPALIVTDGVFSMDGDIAPLPALQGLARRHGAAVYLDEAHATGVLGKTGRGTLEHFGLDDTAVIQMGTLGKALGGFGAYVAGSRDLIDHLINRSKAFIYTTALPSAVSAAASAALDVVCEEPELRERLWRNREHFAGGLKSLGFDTFNSVTPIIPVRAGDNRTAVAFSERLLEDGIFAPAIRPPTVPKGAARIRTAVSAAHSRDDLDFALESFSRIGRSLGLI